MEVVNKLICLTLNKSWQPIGYRTVKDSIIKLCGDGFSSKPDALAIDIDYDIDENGNVDFNSPTLMNPVKWEEWITLPIRSWDLSIKSSSIEIRVPTVIIAVNYNKMPVKTFLGKPSKDGLWERDNGICQYTGEKVSKHDANIDHVIPKSKGGKDSWDNMVICKRKINSKKGNRYNHEVGLNLIRNPETPRPVPVCNLIKDPKHVDWNHFLNK